MKVAIVGAGLTGLSCALMLKDCLKVVLFERGTVGGLLSSYCTGSYCIEKFYHHCFKSDKEFVGLANSLGIKITWKTVRIGNARNGKIYPLNTPVEILRYPGLTLLDKIKLAMFTVKSRKRRYEKEDSKRAVDGIREELGERILREFFIPLLKAKFGGNYEDVSYAWLLARVAIRSNRGLKGEVLGYVRHGFKRLVDRMADGLDIRMRAVKKIEKFGGSFHVNGERFDVVVYTAPIPEMDKRLRIAAGIPEIKYQSSICVLVGARESLTDDLYWTNVPDSVFGAVIEHTHFMPFEDYGEHLLYLASYTEPGSSLFTMKPEEIWKIYVKDLKRLGFDERWVKWYRVFKARYSSPIYERGFIKKITSYRTRIPGFYIAGMTSPPNYPERSMNGSVKAGMEVAEIIKFDYGLS